MTRRSKESPAAGASALGEGNGNPEVTNEYVLAMLKAFNVCAAAERLNGPASFMLAGEVILLEKPFDDLTLGEIAAAYDRAEVRYDRLMELFRRLGVR